MIRMATMVMALSLALVCAASTQERSKAPKDKEKVAESAKAVEKAKEDKQAAKQEVVPAKVKTELEGAVKKYVNSRLDEDDKLFYFWDEDESMDWVLSLKKVFLDRIVKAGERYLVYAEFIQPPQEEDALQDILELGFYVEKQEKDWEIEEVVIYKVNGKLRDVKDVKKVTEPVSAEDDEIKESDEFLDEPPELEESKEFETEDTWGEEE